MTDHRKVINPLLNISVTGATLEDFSQNALLLPAAEAPPVLQPPVDPVVDLQSTTLENFVPNNLQSSEYSTFSNNQSEASAWGSYAPSQQPLPFQPQQGGATPILEEYSPQNQPNQGLGSYFGGPLEQVQQNYNSSQQSAGLQSVFSSFSSYLKLGRPQQQPEEEVVVPSVVDTVLGSVDTNVPSGPVQFYTPDTFSGVGQTVSSGADIPLPFVSTPIGLPPAGGIQSPPTGLPGNTYRRGGFKRPAYAQIPGLSTAPQVPQVQQVPQVPPVNLPPRPPSNHSPFVPIGHRPSPVGTPGIPSASGTPTIPGTIATPPLPTVVPGHIPVTSTIPGLAGPPQVPLIPQIPPITQVQIGGHQVSTVPSVPFIPVIPPTLKQPTPPPTIFNPQLAPQTQAEVASPFLQPVSLTEEIQLGNIPIAGNLATLNSTTLTPTLTPTTYYSPATLSGPILNTTDMSKPNGDSPNATPLLSTKMDSVDQPILTHNETAQVYRPVYHHWFYKKASSDTKVIWTPFSMMDSLNLDTAYLSPDLSPDKVVPTDGGRFDVNILLRERVPVYWEGPKTEVRRCSWFHKGSADGRYVPYEENIATKLEEEFKVAFDTNTWNRRVDMANGESVVFHGPDVLVLFPQTQVPDSWGNSPNQPRPRVVKRGLDEFHIEEGEPAQVDHLLFMVHGIGKFCDLKFRGVAEAVDEFRSMAFQLVQSHYRSSCEQEIANRIEILPISWHSKLHSGDGGVDKKMAGITLESIPRLREFTNDTILDVLFYTSPYYCQTIITSVGNEINRIYDLFKQRNPNFNGGVSLAGHSLGSLILFDILCHQQPVKEEAPVTPEAEQPAEEDQLSPLKPPPNMRKMSRRISYMMAQMGTGQAQITYPNLSFQPRHFFALGSPVGMFVTVRGLENLGEQFALPTCPEYFNIFHPYDPVAYRVESLINPELANLKPMLIPHHKGRKRMHLELKETMARVGADLKQKLIDSMKSTWNSFYQFTLFKGQTNSPQNTPPSLEDEVNKVLEAQLKQDGNASDEDSIVEAEHTDLSLGQLNGGRRIDYVLQEAPLEFFNEYIFALTSHVCYWESNDTILLIVKEIYNSKNISADSQIPQQTMKIERTVSTSSNDDGQYVGKAATGFGMDPTMPIHNNTNIGPPPLAGFVKKS